MPRYIIERQYLLPVYQHLAVEAPDLDTACRKALDDGEHDWEDAQEDYESSRPATIVCASRSPAKRNGSLRPSRNMNDPA